MWMLLAVQTNLQWLGKLQTSAFEDLGSTGFEGFRYRSRTRQGLNFQAIQNPSIIQLELVCDEATCLIE